MFGPNLIFVTDFLNEETYIVLELINELTPHLQFLFRLIIKFWQPIDCFFRKATRRALNKIFLISMDLQTLSKRIQLIPG